MKITKITKKQKQQIVYVIVVGKLDVHAVTLDILIV
jgi:hypothetical protein